MKTILDLFDLFINTSKQLAGYLPQSGSDLIFMFHQLWDLTNKLNFWVFDKIGINVQAILAPIGKLVILTLNFFFDLIKNIVAKL